MIFHYSYQLEDIISLKSYLLSFKLAKNKINILIDQGKITINGLLCKDKDFLLSNNDQILIDTTVFDEEISKNQLPSSPDLEVLYEDDYLIVVNKPSGLLFYDLDNPSNVTLESAVLKLYKEKNLNIPVRFVNRIDKDTTGVVIIAKDILTHSKICNDIASHEVKKEYFTLVYGKILKSGKIDLSIGKSRHENGKMVVTKSGEEAHTLYYPLKNNLKYTLLRVLIKTGRTHQIRVHMQALKHPIVGDKIYGDKLDNKPLCLHCASMSFIHPISSLFVSFSAPLPKYFNDIMKGDYKS